jgi:hypothetical protein
VRDCCVDECKQLFLAIRNIVHDFCRDVNDLKDPHLLLISHEHLPFNLDVLGDNP